MRATGFGTRRCGMCGGRCHELDDFCSDACEQEAERIAEADQVLRDLLDQDPGPELREAA